jgi:hypothetical protein
MASEQNAVTNEETLPLDHPAVTKEAFAEAREEHRDYVRISDIEEPVVEITGDEDQQTYNRKRDEQDPNKRRDTKAERRIAQKHKEAALATQRAEAAERENAELRARYQPEGALESRAFAERKANGNVQESAPTESRVEETGSEPDNQRLSVLKQKYADWDEVVERGKRLSVAPEAAQVLHASPHASEAAYILAKNPELLSELNKLPAKQQAEEVGKLVNHIACTETGAISFAEKVKATLTKEQVAEVLHAAKTNAAGERVVLSLVREINQLPNGPQVMRALLLDPQTSQRLAAMPQASAALELARMSGRMDRNSGPQFVTRAPKPISPTQSGHASHKLPLSDPRVPLKEFYARREAGEV